VNHSLEPRPHVAHVGAALKRPPRIEQPILERVLREVAGQDPPAAGDQARAIPPNQSFECALVAATGELGQPLVGLP
jgi:hypothetical protein